MRSKEKKGKSEHGKREEAANGFFSVPWMSE